jgi:hypothetical protein
VVKIKPPQAVLQIIKSAQQLAGLLIFKLAILGEIG